MRTALLFLAVFLCGSLVSAAERNATPDSLQRILDEVTPGDCIVLAPGVYYGPFTLNRTGSKEKPITIRADRIERGRVILSCADRTLREGKAEWTCEDSTLGLYSVPFTHNPVRVLYSGTDLLPYPTLDCLKSFTLLEGCPGPKHGFFFEPGQKKLYVRLHPSRYGPTDPNRHLMAVGPVSAPGYNGERINKPEHANLTILPRKEGHIVIEGITFETPGGTGVLTAASDVTLRNLWFDGCRFGVCGVLNGSLFGKGRPEGLPERVIVEHSFYHHTPAFDDVAELIREYGSDEAMVKHSIFWWHRKGIKSDRNVMKNYETGIAGGIGTDWEIRYNLISNAFEGLSVWGNSWSENLKVYGNRFENIVDNAIEAESHAVNMQIFDNEIKNVFEPLSWQPEDGTPWPGPVYIYRNLIWADQEFQELWPWRPGCFKIGATDRNWQQPLMGEVPVGEPRSRVSKRFIAIPGDGFLVFNNTIYMPHTVLFNTLEMENQKPARELANFRFINNIFVTKSFHKRDHYRGSLMEFSNNWVIQLQKTSQDQLAAGIDGKVLNGLNALKLTDPANGDFRPLPESPLRGAGTLGYGIPEIAGDVGAPLPVISPQNRPGPMEDK